MWGTHTHVPTADERVLPKGTGYITDLGMTGRVCPEGIEKYADEISVVSTGKNSRISQAENIDIDNHQE